MLASVQASMRSTIVAAAALTFAASATPAVANELDHHGGGDVIEASYQLAIEVHGLYATVEARQRVLAVGNGPTLAVYRFELPGDAAVTGFTIAHGTAAAQPGVITTAEGALSLGFRFTPLIGIRAGVDFRQYGLAFNWRPGELHQSARCRGEDDAECAHDPAEQHEHRGRREPVDVRREVHAGAESRRGQAEDERELGAAQSEQGLQRCEEHAERIERAERGIEHGGRRDRAPRARPDVRVAHGDGAGEYTGP